MDPSIKTLIDAATRLDAALTGQTGPVSMAVRVAHIALREALAGVQTPESRPLNPAYICTKRKDCPWCETEDFMAVTPGTYHAL